MLKIDILKNILLLYLVVISYRCDNCVEGCLKCNSMEECVLCDLNLNYILEGTKCIKKIPANCQKQNILGNCIQCNGNYFLEKETNFCIPIDLFKRVPNCLEYDMDQNCIRCLQLHQIKNGFCQKVKKIIPNCKYYSSNENICDECYSEHTLNISQEKCFKNDLLIYKEKNCQKLSIISCEFCSENYFKEPDLYIQEYLNLETNTQKQILLSQMINFENQIQNYSTYFSCIKANVQNCQILKSWNQCLKCKDQNYLTNNYDCLPFPKNTITNCKKYFSINSCIECQQGYFLETQIKCTRVQTIKNCKFYNGKISQTQCIECLSNYYLKNQQCFERIFSSEKNLLNCQKRFLTEDKCYQCNQFYVLSVQGLKCLPQVVNCKKHKQFSKNFQDAQCEECENEYYLNSPLRCELGNVQNCQVYSFSSEICQECKNGFYLKGELCLPHKNINNCKIYNHIIQDQCQECENNFVILQIKNYCQELKIIENCQVYDVQQGFGCKICQDKYYTKNYECIKITLQNCLKSQDNLTCEECEIGYLLMNSQCIQYPIYFQEDCLKTNGLVKIDNFSSIQCLVCKENYFPINVINTSICVNQQNLINYKINQIENCVKYQNNTCVQCKIGFFLQLDQQNNQCLQNCSLKNSTNSYSKLQIKKIEQNYEVSSNHVCYSQNNQGCLIYGPNSKNHLEQICIQCDSEYLNLISLEIENTSFVSNQDKNLIPNPFYEILEVNCVEKQIFIQNNIPIDENCEFYKIESFGYYACQRCKMGYIGIPQENSIKQCQQSKDIYHQCSDEEFQNLDTIWKKYFSCHKCLERNQIPFLAIKTKSIGNPYPDEYIPYQLKNLKWAQQNETSEPSIQCLSIDFENFGYFAQNKELFQIPQNCALGVINLSHQDGNSLDNKIPNQDINLAIYCVACKPGYFPIENQNFNFVKVECIEIQNCQKKSSTFNICSQCEDKFVFDYNTTNEKIDFQKCQQNQVKNCLASDSIVKCKVCKKSYFLNPQEQCEPIISKHCLSNEFYQPQYYASQQNYKWKYYLSQNGPGCSQCQENFFAVIQQTQQIYCLKNTYNNVTQSYIMNCKYYTMIDNSIKCYQCQEDFVISENQQNCYETPKNCIEGISQLQCKVCKKNYSLVNKQCIQGNIENCQEYNENIDQQQMTCLQCQKGYFLNLEKKCEKGKVQNCELFNDQDPFHCKKCQLNYFLVKKIQIDSCLKIPEGYNCSVGNIQVMNNKPWFVCQKCYKENQQLAEMSNIQNKNMMTSYCLQYSLQQNCKSYKVNQHNFEETTFECIECIQEYYLENYFCKKRQITTKNCIQYDLNKDQCIECESEFYLIDGIICQKNSNGIQNCSDYQSEKICNKCEKNYFLKNNQCFQIGLQQQIKNCNYYKDENTCSQCQQNYALENNICILSQIKDCLEFIDQNTCKICKEGFGIKINKNQTLCEALNNENCLQYQFIENLQKNQCIKCKEKYYLNEQNQCVQLSKQIKDCIYQNNEDQCLQCKKGTILSLDKKICFINENFKNHLDVNCESLKVVEPFCTQCQPGYFPIKDDIENIKCLKCKQQNDEGCFMCSQNLIDCLVCNTGYYMNKEKKCIKTIPKLIKTQYEAINNIMIKVINLSILLLSYQLI